MIVMKELMRITWLVDDVFGDPFVRLWKGELIASPTLDNPYLEGDLSLLSLIGVNEAESGDWGWLDLEPQSVENLPFRYSIVSSLGKGITSGTFGEKAWAIETYEYAKKNQQHLKEKVHTEFFSKGFIRHQLLPQVISGNTEGTIKNVFSKYKRKSISYIDWKLVIFNVSDLKREKKHTEPLTIPSIVLKYRGENFKKMKEDFPFTPETVQFCRNRFKERKEDTNELKYKHYRYGMHISQLFNSINGRLKRDAKKAEKNPNYKRKYEGIHLRFSKNDFYRYTLKQEDYKIFYRLWVAHHFDQAWTPTVDRIDPKGDYCFDNIRFVPLFENSIDGALEGLSLIGEKEGKTVYFWSQKKASELLHVSYNEVLKAVKNNSEIDGWVFTFIPKTQLFQSFVETLVIPEQLWDTRYIKIFRFNKNFGLIKTQRYNNPNVDIVATCYYPLTLGFFHIYELLTLLTLTILAPLRFADFTAAFTKAFAVSFSVRFFAIFSTSPSFLFFNIIMDNFSKK